MSLEQQEIERLERRMAQHIRKHLSEWLSEMCYSKPPQVYEIELRERMIRVEEELKKQRELMLQFMHQVDKRFEQVDKRFELIEKRFEQVDKRFEEINNRLDKFMRWSFATTLTVGGLIVAAIKLLPPF